MDAEPDKQIHQARLLEKARAALVLLALHLGIAAGCRGQELKGTGAGAQALERFDRQGVLVRGEADREMLTIACCIMRNLICGMAKYGYIKDRRPYVSESDGRLHFDMSEHTVTAENVSPAAKAAIFATNGARSVRSCRADRGRR